MRTVDPGIYSFSVLKHFSPEVMDKPYVKGVTVFVPWRDVEPEKGAPDWRRLDAVFEEAKRTNKPVNLQINAGYLRPDWVLEEEGVEVFEYSRRLNAQQEASGVPKSVRVGLPWDKRYLSLFYDFMRSVSQRYADNPSLQYVMINGPTIASPEMIYPIEDELDIERFIEAGFSNETIIRAWMEAVDVFSLLFPDKPLCFGPAPVFSDPVPASDVTAYARDVLGKRLVLLTMHLNGKWFDRMRMGNPVRVIDENMRDAAVSAGLDFGFQMYWFFSGEGGWLSGPMDKALENGVSYGASWIEVWQKDLLNPEYSQDFITTHGKLAAP